MTLRLNVFHDGIVGHVAATAAKVASRPDVPSPKFLPQMRKFVQQLVGRLPLQALQKSADRNLRRYRHEQVNMVLRHMPLENRNIMMTTDLPDQIPNPCPNFARQHPTPILRNPDQMQMNLVHSVRAMPIVFHAPNLAYRKQKLLKPSPKGEGFNPPRVGQ